MVRIDRQSRRHRLTGPGVRTDQHRTPLRLRPLAASLLLLSVVGVAHAADLLPSGTLPIPVRSMGLHENIATSGAVTGVVAGHTLTLTQGTSRAIIPWQSFNIAADSAVIFQQPDASSAVLNRIGGLDPSIIQGRLSANGQVYLLNANGILFDRGAQVNVQSLVASSLDITDRLFADGPLSQVNGVPAFSGTSGFVRVEGGARIETPRGGNVWLFAPNVENRGTIDTTSGQVVLAAGQKVYLASSTDTALRGVMVQVDSGGTATNIGDMVARQGRASLVGLAVNQSGRMSATTSVTANGIVELLAQDTVAIDNGADAQLRSTRAGTVLLGAGSRIEVRPDANATATITDQQTFSPSVVNAVGRTIRMAADARIDAPGGIVTMRAVANPAATLLDVPGAAANDARIWLDPGAVINVAGTTETVAMARNFVQVELRANELRDAPLQKNGPLRGQSVTVDIRQGTPLADISGAVAQIGRTANERLTKAGRIDLQSEGDVVLNAGSRLDVSGGRIDYLAGSAATTRLRTATGRVVDIGSATPDILYSGIVGGTVHNRAFDAYSDGADAGAITIVAPKALLGATLAGQTTAGLYQRDPGRLPLAGRFVFGRAAGSADASLDFHAPDVLLAGSASAPAAALDFSSPLPDVLARRVVLSADALRSGGFGQLELYSNGVLDVAQDVALDLGARGDAILQAQRITIAGSLSAAGGTIRIASRRLSEGVASVPDQAVVLTGSASLSTRGEWVNESRFAAPSTAPRVIAGGTVALAAVGDLRVAAGSLIDVSGGARLDASGNLEAGAAGTVTLASNTGDPENVDIAHTARLALDGTLLGHAFVGGRGGTLSITAGSVTVGSQARGTPGELLLTPDWFRAGGFSDFRITGIDGVHVDAPIDLAGVDRGIASRVPAAYFHRMPSGTALGSPLLSSLEVRPDVERVGASLRFTASSPYRGTLEVARNAAIRVDPEGSITLEAARQLTMLGSLTAPAGTIALTMRGDPSRRDQDIGFLADQTIWIGADATLSATGATRIEADRSGWRRGAVLAGGAVTITANKGYVVAESGSMVDVSGVTGTVDMRTSVGAMPESKSVAGAAGAITVRAREGLFVDATLRGSPGGPAASGGALTFALDRQEDPTDPTTTPRSGYPDAARTLVVRSFGRATDGLARGTAVDASRNGLGFIDASAIRSGGFDVLRLESGDVIRFDDTTTLTARRSITLDAPILSGLPGTHASVATSYAAIGNTDPRYQQTRTPRSGTATLSVVADLIDLGGTTIADGMTTVTFASRGDVRLYGVLTTDLTRNDLAGAFGTAGDLVVRAVQTYPTTRSQFTLSAGRSVDFLDGGSAAAPISAGGQLTVTADTIRVAGTLRAPQGSIVLKGSAPDGMAASIRLEETALLSVAGSGDVPFGLTQNGTAWFQDLGNRLVAVTAPPAKRIELNARDVRMLASGTLDPATGEPIRRATVDVGGGGDLLAYEFLPGPGGSTDLLAQPGIYAIIPGLRSAFAPRDWASDAAGAPAPGDSVYLSGFAGVDEGTHALLPARYALLPGAYAVRFLPDTREVLPASNTVLADGSLLVAGHRTVHDGSVRAPDNSAVLLLPATTLRAASELRLTRATQFFGDGATPAPPGPADAGDVAIRASGLLQLDGALRMASAAGRGGALDIAADRIVVTDGAPSGTSGALEIDARRLSASGAASLMLGALRSSDGSGRITPVASTIRIAGGATLSGPEIVLVAGDSITLDEHAKLTARATGSAASSTWQIAGDGALLRAAAGTQGTLLRTGVSAPGARNGSVTIHQGAEIDAAALLIDATRDTVIDAAAVLRTNALDLSAGKIGIGDVTPGRDGLVLTGSLLDRISEVGTLALRSYDSIDFFGDITLATGATAGGSGSLRLDAGSVTGDGHVVVRADRVRLANSTGSAAASTGPAATTDTTLRIEAARGDLVLERGAIAFTGFADSTLAAAGDIRIEGRGTLSSDGNLAFETGQVSTASASQWHITAHDALRVSGTSLSAAAPAVTAPGLGGTLALEGRSVSVTSVLRLASGTLSISARDDLTIGAGGTVDVSGVTRTFFDVTGSTGGGTLRLTSQTGSVRIADGGHVDVSGAPAGGDAGLLDVAASEGHLLLDGSMSGRGAAGARGGRFTLDAGRVDELADLGGRLADGGFTDTLRIRSRHGDLAIASGVALGARSITLEADAGNITVAGMLDASGVRGGSLALWAGMGATLANGATLRAVGTAGDGGSVTVGTAAGRLEMLSGSRIDVRGNGGADGTVLLRAPRSARDVAIDLAGAIDGSRETVVEGFAVREGVASVGATAQRPALGITTIATEIAGFMANANDIVARLGHRGDPTFHLRAGVEIRSDGDLALVSDWNLFSATPPGNEPGILTLRATGDLRVNGSLSDGFAGVAPASALQSSASWSYRLVAGADASAANPMGTDVATGGNVAIATNKLVRTGTGRIDIAAAGDITFGTGATVYTAGTPSAAVADFTLPVGTTPNYPERGGDVTLRAGNDIIGSDAGQFVNDWLHRQGRTNASGGFALQTSWWISYADFRQTVGALGGGNVAVAAGRDLVDVSAVIPTTGRLAGADPATAVLTETGGGDLDVAAGRDIAGGLFFVGRGDASIGAGGTIGSTSEASLAPVIALMDAGVRLHAGRGLEVQGVFDPTLVPQGRSNVRSALDGKVSYFSTYADTSRIVLESDTGDVVLRNGVQAIVDAASGLRMPSGSPDFLFAVHPGSLSAVAHDGDVRVLGRAALYPSPRGELELLAGRSVTTAGTLYMADQDPLLLPRTGAPESGIEPLRQAFDAQADSGLAAHAGTLLHRGNPVPVRLYAAGGDVRGPGPASGELLGIFPKALQVRAAGDIVDASISAQNTDTASVTLLSAGRDILFTIPRDDFGRQQSNASRISVGGPGRLEVIAGRDIDLGNALGILTRGNRANPALPSTGADLLVAAGFGSTDGDVRWPSSMALVEALLDRPDVDGVTWRTRLGEYLASIDVDAGTDPVATFRALSPERQLPFATRVFTGQLKVTGREAAQARAVGNAADYKRADEAIAMFLPSPGTRGDVRMFFSQLKTERGGAIDLLVPAGTVNAGLASPPSDLDKTPAELGIVTVSGGDVRAFVRNDFLVNQSRVFTLGGGDILLWSDFGSIDAGRGRKGVTYAPAPAVIVKADGTVEIDASDAVSGSGIATLLTRADILPGDVDLYARRGDIDAGDAGIRLQGRFYFDFGGNFLNAGNTASGGGQVGLVERQAPAPGSVAAGQTAALDTNASVSDRLRAGLPIPTANPIGPVSFLLTVEVLGWGVR